MTPEKLRRKTLFGIIATLIIPLHYWLSGFSFDHRGDELATCFGTTVCLVAITVIFID